jgi:molybdenum cofactor cytidylyltransferase
MINGGVDAVVVVASADAPGIREALTLEVPEIPTDVVVNTQWKTGQLSSLIAGIDAAGSADAILVCPVDMPLFTATTVSHLIETFRATGAPVVRPAAGGRHGHPVLFSRALFDELRHADPALGARPVVRAHAHEAVDVLVDDPGAFVDIDTPDDYARWVTNAARAPESDDGSR